MKKIFFFVILIATFATCQDSNNSSANTAQSLRNVGAKITNEEALRWTTRFKDGKTKRQQTTAISRASLEQVVNNFTDYDGIYFTHAIEGDKHHVILLPYKDGHSLWTAATAIDANSDSEIDVATASVWAEQYVKQNADGPWSHFFGRNMFETILSRGDFENMEIVPAINDAGLPQLLLVVSYSSTLVSGRTQGAVEVYDHSNQCPPYCPDQAN
jgi:hypothetical protein